MKNRLERMVCTMVQICYMPEVRLKGECTVNERER